MLIGARLLEPLILDRVASAGVLPVWKLWLGAVANSFQFYWMFAGYTHLILGLGLLVGFKLPENFNNPYIATSISDFWRRWHMSLSFWIRDYVYIPLGGNRKGLLRKCANIILAMGVCGIWHGLELHYFLWGLFHGVLLSVESVCNHQNWHPLRNRLGAAYVPVKIVIIFGLVTFSWLLFKYPMPDFLAYMRGLTR
jgi:alginate O-acetyltransferase complex protein AlgI